jgi:hypothetical protein
MAHETQQIPSLVTSHTQQAYPPAPLDTSLANKQPKIYTLLWKLKEMTGEIFGSHSGTAKDT